MIVIPAIDLLGGKCVRLVGGRREECTVYPGTPAGIARGWADAGAEWLHVVDLDAAFEQRCFANLDGVKAILGAVDVPVQVGGGVRTPDDVRKYLDIGAARVILGTAALESRGAAKEMLSRFGGRLAVALDSRDGKVAVRGWLGDTGLDTVGAAKMMEDDGAKTLIVTDIRRDGALARPNLDLIAAVADAAAAGVIASGGVSSLDDLLEIKRLGRRNVTGVITGKALYEKAFDLAAAITLLRSAADCAERR
ncbi:MAG: 1-(5-phosphoribosyl)-5-[(5-phosphoribosylamino)methylideneamino]imidazole-4-carboxamide isomerase [bacterium]